MDVLEKLFFDLGNVNDNDSLDCISIVQNIESFVLEQSQPDDMQQVIYLLAKSVSPPSLSTFIIVNINKKSKDIVKARGYALKFLHTYFKRAHDVLAPYISFFVTWIVDVLRRDDTNEIKASVLLPLRSICSYLFASKMEIKLPDLEYVFSALFSEYDNKKTTSTLKYNIMVIFGHLVRLFPADIATMSAADKIIYSMLQVLVKNFESKAHTPELSLIAGAFSCLDRCMFDFEDKLFSIYAQQFAPSSSGPLGPPPVSVMLWRCLMRAVALATSDSVSRYAIISKALRLIKNHSFLFQDIIGNNMQTSYSSLEVCYFSTKSGVDKHAEEALWAVLTQFTEYSTAHISAHKGEPHSNIPAHILDTLKSLVKSLLEQVNTVYQLAAPDKASVLAGSTALLRSMVLGVKGITALSPAIASVCRSGASQGLLWAAEVVPVLVAACEQFTDLNPQSSSVAVMIAESKPAVMWHNTQTVKVSSMFLSAISVSLPFSVGQSQAVLQFISRSSWLVVTSYSRVQGAKQRSSSQVSLSLALFGLALADPAMQRQYVGELVSLLLVRAMSRIEEAESVEVVSLDPATGDKDCRLNLAYALLTSELLCPANSETLRVIKLMEKSSSNACYTPQVSAVLVSAVFAECGRVIGTLNLQYSIPNQDPSMQGTAESSDPTLDLASSARPIPENPFDHEMLLNLSSYLEHLLLALANSTGRYSFHEVRNYSSDLIAVSLHINTLLGICILMSTKLPLVSALLRIVTTTVSIAELLGLLHSEETDAMNINDTPAQTPMLVKFYGAVSKRITGEFQFELLSSALRMVLSAPATICSALSQEAVVLPCVSKALTSGFQVPLALETIIAHIDEGKVSASLFQIVPLLEPLIQLKPEASNNNPDILQSKETPVHILALRILGKLGGLNKMILKPTGVTLKESLRMSDFHRNLSVDLPVEIGSGSSTRQENIAICVGRAVPRLIVLCQDLRPEARQLRIMASEALHGIALVLIGKMATGETSSSDDVNVELIQCLLPHFTVFASSSEPVVRDLFQTLLNQLIHWASSFGRNVPNLLVPSADCQEKLSICLLDNFVSGLGSSKDSNASSDADASSSSADTDEVCSSALVESLRWCLKYVQSSNRQDDTMLPFSVESILSRLFLLVGHPNISRRISAAMVLTRLHKFIREEVGLVHRYNLRIVFVLLTSLRHLGDRQKECSIAIEKYVKTISSVCMRNSSDLHMIRYGLWRSTSGTTDTPAESEHVQFPYTLRDLVDWCFNSIAHEDFIFRRQCMKCLCDLAPLLCATASSKGGCETAILDYVSQRFGGSLLNGVVSAIEGSCATSSASICSAADLRSVIGMLDAHNWLLNYLAMCSPSQILGSVVLDVSGEAKQKRRKTDNPDLERHSSILSVVNRCLSSWMTRLNDPSDADVSITTDSLLAELLRRVLQLLFTVATAEPAFLGQCLEFVGWENVRALVMCSLLGTSGCERGAEEEAVGLLFPASMHATSEEVRDNLPSAIKTFFGAFEEIVKDSSTNLLLGKARTFLEKSEWADRFRFALKKIAPLFSPNYIAVFRKSLDILLECRLLSGLDSTDCLLEAKRLLTSLLAAYSSPPSSTHRPLSQDCIGDVLHIVLALGLPVIGSTSAFALNQSSLLSIIFDCSESLSLRFVSDCESTLVRLVVGRRGENLTTHGSALLQFFLADGVNVSSRHFLLSKVLSLLSQSSSADSEDSVHLESVKYSFLELCMARAVDHSGVLLIRPKLLELLLLFVVQGTSDGKVPTQSLSALAMYRAMYASLLKTLSNPQSSTDSILESFQLLAYFLPGTTQNSPVSIGNASIESLRTSQADDEISACLEEIVANKFPLQSTTLDTASENGKSFSKILRVWLDVFALCGSPCLLRPLIPTIREGRRHLYYKWLQDAMKAYLENVALGNALSETSDGPPSLSLSPSVDLALQAFCCMFRFCLEVFQDIYQDAAVKDFFYAELFFPMLKRCSASMLLRIVASDVWHGRIVFSKAASKPGSLFITQIVDIVGSAENLVQQIRMSSSIDDASRSSSETKLMEVLCCFDVLTALYETCALDSLKGEVTRAYAGPDASGKELTQALCRMSHKLVRSDITLLAGWAIRPQLQKVLSAAYKCLLIVVAKTQQEEQFFDSFLFKEKQQDPGHMFWCNVVDCSKEYKFRTIHHAFDTVFLGRRSTSHPAKTFSSTRKAISSQLKGEGAVTQYLHGVSSDLACGNSLSLAASQAGDHSRSSGASQSQNIFVENIANPFVSLSQQVVSPGDDGEDGELGSKKLSTTSSADDEYRVDGPVKTREVGGLDDCLISLEGNDVNSEAVMGMLVRVLHRMHFLFKDKWGTGIPYWLAVVNERLSDYCPRSFHSSNVRLFMLRLLLNQPVCAIAAPWVYEILPSVIECCNKDLCTSTSVVGDEDGYNYFLRDVVFTICNSWRDVRVGGLANRSLGKACALFLSYLIRHVFHSNTDVSKENVQSVCALISLWAGGQESTALRSEIDLSPLLALLTTEEAYTGGAHATASSRGSESVKRRLCGLQVMLALVDARYPVFTLSNADAEPLLGAIANGCKFSRKEVSEQSALLCGAMLASWRLSTPEEMKGLIQPCRTFASVVEGKILSLLTGKDGADEVAICVRAVCRKYPLFVTREMLLKLFASFNRLKVRKVDFVEVLVLCSANDGAKRFVDMSLVASIQPYLLALLGDVSTVAFGKGVYTYRLPLVQIFTVRLLKQLASEVCSRKDVLTTLLVGAGDSSGLELMMRHESQVEVRREVYSLLVALHHQLNAAVHAPVSGYLQVVRVLLLHGLTDPDDGGMMVSSDSIDPAPTSENVVTAAAAAYLKSTSESGIRKTVYDFFNKHVGLSTCPISRLKRLMTDLFHPDSSTGDSSTQACLSSKQVEQWLLFSSYLLLSSIDGLQIESRVDRKVFLFLRGISSSAANQPFQVLKLGRGTASASMSSTYSSMFTLENSQQYSQLHSAVPFASQLASSQSNFQGLLRGTQEVSWSQTSQTNVGLDHLFYSQQVGGDTASTAMEVDNAAPPTVSMRPPVGLPSRLGKTPVNVIGQKVPVRFSDKLADVKHTPGEGGKTSYITRKNEWIGFASKARRDQKIRQNLLRRAGKVTLLRRYRDGDLPDILISARDLILPLQNLTLQDAGIAGIVFDALFESIYSLSSASKNSVSSESHASNDSGAELKRGLATMLCGSGDPSAKSGGSGLLNVWKCTKLISSLFSAATFCLSRDMDGGMNCNILAGMNPRYICESAITSNNPYGGIMLIENIILAQYNVDRKADQKGGTGALRNRKEATEGSTELWLELSTLFRRVEDTDALTGMLQPLSTKSTNTKLALEFEVRGNYSKAIELYNGLAMEESDVDSGSISEVVAQSQAWSDRQLDCLQRLGDWGQLDEKLDNMFASQFGVGCDKTKVLCDSDGSDSKQGDFCRRVFSFYFKSLVYRGGMQPSHNPDSQSLLRQGPRWAETSSFLNAITTSSNQGGSSLTFDPKVFSEIHHLVDMAACFGSVGEWQRAAAYVTRGYDDFVAKWSTLNPCATTAKAGLLAGLERLVELEEGVGLHTLSGGSACVGVRMDQCLRRWKKCRPLATDSLSVWNDVCRVREICLLPALEVAKGQAGWGTLKCAVTDHLADFHVSIALSAIHHDAMQVVKQELGISSGWRRCIPSQSNAPRLSIEELFAAYHYNRKNVENAAIDEEGENRMEKISGMFIKTESLLNKKIGYLESEKASETSEYHMLQTKLLKATWLSTWGRFLRSERHGDFGYQRSLESCALYKDIADGAPENLHSLSVNEQRSFGEAFGSYGKLCEELVSENVISAKDKAEFVVVAVDSYLKGLQLGDAASRDRVLPMLSLLGDSAPPASGRKVSNASTDRLSSFKERLAFVPPWTFLQQCPQIIGVLDLPAGPFAIAILEHVAQSYPAALYHPMTVSRPGFGENAQKLTARLEIILRNEVMSKFVDALSCLAHPQLRWMDGLKELIDVLRKKANPKVVMEKTKELVNTCLETSWAGIGSKIGAYNARFAREMKKEVGKVLQDGTAPTLKDIEGLLENARSTMSTRNSPMNMKFASGKVRLSEFSEWLVDFGSSGSNSENIEIPGQYLSCITRAPDIAQHAMVLSVHPELLVMSSLRKPKRICLLGSNGRFYYFLVKGGEDLRNDERIEQLFMLMNRVLVANDNKLSISDSADDEDMLGTLASTGLAGLGLQARTYGVMPMTTKLGLIEWVGDTVPLKAIISEEMARDDKFLSVNPGARKSAKDVEFGGLLASDERSKWLKRSEDAKSYHDMFRNARSDSAKKLWRKMCLAVPDDFLRRRFLRMASSAEVFVIMRGQFARSLATNSIFGYIVGLGDRHLENLLVDVRGGSLVQIDFGASFGFATSVLPVPELIPFRLTNQLLGLFCPLDGTALVRHHMISVMGALRTEDGKQMLANALAVYLNDPVVDWLKNMPKHGVDKSEISWEPRRRIENSLKKLEGVNPAAIFCDDLSANPTVTRLGSFDALQNILWQSAALSSSTREVDADGENIGVVSRSRKLNTADQIDTLIDIATDPNVLVRQYVGLLTWI